MKSLKEELKEVKNEKYHNTVKIYKELFEKFKKCGNLNVENTWEDGEEKYKTTRTDRYINAIESVMCDELQKLKDDANLGADE